MANGKLCRVSERTTTIRAREIGHQLRWYRERAGFSQHGAGRKIALSTASICRMEDGTKMPSAAEVASLLTLYGIVGPGRDVLIAIAREAAERGWWQRHNPDYHRRLNTLASLESRACSITTFELARLPGLLQAPVYAEAQMRQPGKLADDEIRRRVDARMARQQVLFRQDPLHLVAFLDESALHRMPGSAAVMHRQLDYLTHLAEKPNVIIRVLPMSAGPQAGEIGAFHLLRFALAPSVVHVTNWASQLYMEDAAEIERYDDAVYWLVTYALDTGESAGLITRLMRRLEDDPDVLPHVDRPPAAEEQR